MASFAALNPFEPISSRLQAERAVDGSAGAWLIIGVLFSFGTVGTLGSSRGGWAGIPAWSIFLGLTAVSLILAAIMTRAKSVPMASITLVAAVLMSLYAIGAVVTGKGAMGLVPIVLLGLSVRGYRGARALKAFQIQVASEHPSERRRPNDRN